MGLGTFIGVGLGLLGADKEAKGTKEAGRRARQRGREQQVFNEVAAIQAQAVGQLQAFEEERQAELLASRAIAVAAAGGSVSDVDHIIADIYGEGAYRASIALYEAETRAEQLRFQGRQAAKYGADQYEAAKDAASGIRLSALGSLFKVF